MRIVMVLALVAGCSGGTSTPHALVVGIDGMRPDAFERANAPNLDALFARGASTMRATTQLQARTRSGPGWASILTGVDADKHRVLENESFPMRDRSFPSMLARAKVAGRSTAAICNWYPLITEFIAEEKSADFEKLAPADPWVTDETLSALASDYELVFVHLDEVDHTGHFSGFSPDNPEYVAAIERKDAQVGQILTRLRARPNFAREAWLIVVVTDHGGAGNDHGALDAENRTIPLAFEGAGVKQGALPDGVSHTDVTPTVLAHLGLAPDAVFDGKVLSLR